MKPQFYATLAQFARAPGNTRRSMTLVVRTAGDPAALAAPGARGRSGASTRGCRSPKCARWTTSSTRRSPSRASRCRLLGLFGVLALVLSAIGIFGIVSQVVASRAHEFGIRAALGATPRELVMLSLRTGVRQAVAGLVRRDRGRAGRHARDAAMLHGVTPTDPGTFAA